mgnify:CR=1 FL=1
MNIRLLLLLLFIFIGSFILLEVVSAGEQIVIKQATLPSPRYLLSCAEDSSTHKIYCFGGDPATQILEYDPIADNIIIMLIGGPIYGTSCAEHSGTHKIYCFGGYTSTTNQIAEYTPSTNQLVIKQAILPTGRGGLSCVEDSVTHKFYCFGGEPATDQILEYDPAMDRVVIKQATLPSPRFQLSCAEGRGVRKIYCFGGRIPTSDQILEYNPLTDTITIKSATVPTPRFGLTCALLSSSTATIYCFGGFGPLSQIFSYNYRADQITIRPVSLPVGRYHAGCAGNSISNKIYCFGGATTAGATINQIVEYTPPFDTTLSPPSLLTPPRISDTLDIELSDSAHPGSSYMLVMSLGDTPGITLSDNRNIPLNYDFLLQTTLFSPFSFGLFDSQSRFNNNGIGTAYWNIPNNPNIAGTDIYFGFVTVDFRQPLPQAILSISRSQKIQILPSHFTPDTNTVALWDFNEGSGSVLNDLSGNNHHGTVNGAAWAPGIDGTSLHFDGIDDYVTVSDSPLFAFTNAFTIEAYVFFEGTLGDTTIDTIVGKDYQYIFGIGDTVFPDHLVYAVADQPSNSCLSSSNLCDGVATVPRNAWHHVAVQYDGTNLKTIIDGQVISENPAQFTPGSAPHDLSIGSRLTFLDLPVPVAFFKGKIDEVRISNIARY